MPPGGAAPQGCSGGRPTADFYGGRESRIVLIVECPSTESRGVNSDPSFSNSSHFHKKTEQIKTSTKLSLELSLSWRLSDMTSENGLICTVDMLRFWLGLSASDDKQMTGLETKTG